MGSKRQEQYHDGQEHQPFNYRRATVVFIYTFSWDVTRRTFGELERSLCGADGKWVRRMLHERSLPGSCSTAIAYQPTLLTRAAALECSEALALQTVLAPIEEYRGTDLGRCAEIPVELRRNIRLFDNGSGTCTFVAGIAEPVTFAAIHHVLHLAHNIDHGDDEEWEHAHLTNSYLRLSSDASPHSLLPASATESCTFAKGYVSLHDLFRKAVKSQIPALLNSTVDSEPDFDVLEMGALTQDFQAPFVFTIAEVEEQSYLRLQKAPSRGIAREVASILCKMTMDNRHVDTDFHHLSDDYLRRVLPYDTERDALLNLCLDRRLFFMFHRRGAIAVGSKLDDIPAAFVVPALVNLCELLRARWHLGNVVNARLDQAIADACESRKTASEISSEIFRWRALFAHFYRDPAPFLFDGGSVTDVAEIADEQLWLRRLSTSTNRKFQLLDAIVRDLYDRKRFEDLRSWQTSS